MNKVIQMKSTGNEPRMIKLTVKARMTSLLVSTWQKPKQAHWSKVSPVASPWPACWRVSGVILLMVDAFICQQKIVQKQVGWEEKSWSKTREEKERREWQREEKWRKERKVIEGGTVLLSLEMSIPLRTQSMLKREEGRTCLVQFHTSCLLGKWRM